MIQANIGDFEKIAAEAGLRGANEKVLTDFFTLSDQALAMDPKPAALIWPETAYPGTFRTPESADDLGRDERVENFVRTRGVPLYFGGYDHFGRKDFNAFFFLSPRQPVAGGESDLQIYRKNMLLLFGEYIPGAETFKFIADAFPEVGNFGRGPGPVVLNVPTADPKVHSIAVGPIICYEALFPSYVLGGRPSRKRAHPQHHERLLVRPLRRAGASSRAHHLPQHRNEIAPASLDQHRNLGADPSRRRDRPGHSRRKSDGAECPGAAPGADTHGHEKVRGLVRPHLADFFHSGLLRGPGPQSPAGLAEKACFEPGFAFPVTVAWNLLLRVGWGCETSESGYGSLSQRTRGTKMEQGFDAIHHNLSAPYRAVLTPCMVFCDSKSLPPRADAIRRCV